MKDLLVLIVKQIVKHPDEVSVTDKQENGELTLQLRVSPEDMGIVIGKGGKVIKAIRNLIRTKAILQNSRVNLILIEE
jgi:predicted RNA-binding protein YlqC (UPF0109 family)